jgi:acyl-CoA dehydrogenase
VFGAPLAEHGMAQQMIADNEIELAAARALLWQVSSDELVVGRIYADVRAFRIYDGASEVHRMSIAKRAARRARADG